MKRTGITALGFFVGVHPEVSRPGWPQRWLCVMYRLSGTWQASSQHATREEAMAHRREIFKLHHAMSLKKKARARKILKRKLARQP